MSDYQTFVAVFVVFSVESVRIGILFFLTQRGTEGCAEGRRVFGGNFGVFLMGTEEGIVVFLL